MNDYVIRDSEGVDLEVLAAVRETVTGRAVRPCPYGDPECTGKHRTNTPKSEMCPSAYRREKERKKEYRKANAEREKERSKEYYAANAERIKEYRKANAERLKEYDKAYNKANAERKREYDRERYAANAERYREYGREYQKANPEVYRAIQRKRRETKKARAGRYDSQIIVQPTCHLCRLPIEPGQPTHVDHVIALNEEMPDGLVSGLRVCHASCNVQRQDKPIAIFLLANLRRQHPNDLRISEC